MSNAPIDPLDFFYQLETKKEAKTKVEEGDRLYPGSTPPRNSLSIDSEEEVWLNSLPSQEFLVNGESRRFYTIGALAQALGKQPVTVRSWEQKGWLPAASFRTPTPRGTQIPGKVSKGRRLYSKEQILFLTEGYNKYILAPRHPNWDGFRSHIKNKYPK